MDYADVIITTILFFSLLFGGFIFGRDRGLFIGQKKVLNGETTLRLVEQDDHSWKWEDDISQPPLSVPNNVDMVRVPKGK